MDSWLVSLCPDDIWKWIYHLSRGQQTTPSHQNQRICRFAGSGGFPCGAERCSVPFLLQDGALCNLPHAWLSWVHVIRWFFSYASVTNLCSLVLDRYIAIVKPLEYLNCMTRRRVIQMISLSWAVPVVFHILPAASIVLSISILFPIFLWVVMVVFEFLPCVMLIFCFVSMLSVIWKHDRAARTFAKQLSFNHRVVFKAQERSAVKMMAVVISLVLLCYAVHLRCSFLSVVNVQKLCNDIDYKVPILVLNSAVNPVAYAFFKRDIKKDIIRKLMYCASFKRPN